MANLKKHHHFVPQFWIKAFRDSNEQLHSWDGKNGRVVAARDIMQEHWLYTLFNKQWQPSDVLEDALGEIEGIASKVFVSIGDLTYVPTSDDREVLSMFIGLQACRHPDVLNRGHRRARELANALAQVHDFPNVQSFLQKMSEFGIGPIDSRAIYHLLLSKTSKELNQELQEIEGLSPQDSRLPIQDALRADELIAREIQAMSLSILDAPAGSCFILGDTPMPQSELAAGFCVPLSKTVSLEAKPGASSLTLPRRAITPAEVGAINQVQWSNAREIVVGPDPTALRSL